MAMVLKYGKLNSVETGARLPLRAGVEGVSE